MQDKTDGQDKADRKTDRQTDRQIDKIDKIDKMG